MYVERLLQINIVTLAAFGTLLLGMGQQSATLPLAAATAAIVAVWITDITGWFHLNRLAGNAAALVAGFLTLLEVYRYGITVQVLDLANVLVYLQIILLFQRKTLRTYWELCMLSFAQAVVATAYNQGILFGFLLVLYLATGLSTLGLLYLHRERTRYSPSKPAAVPIVATARWPLAGQEASFSGNVSGSSRFIPVEFWYRLLRVTLASLVIAVLLFAVLPRPGGSAWQGAAQRIRHSIGFSDKVTLGELGRVIEDPEEVLRIEFYSAATGDPYRVLDEVYLRGATLTRYDRGQWSYRVAGLRRHAWDRRSAPWDGPPYGDLVRQSIAIEPMDREELFCVWPFTFPDGQFDDRLRYERSTQRLLRGEELSRSRLSYELDTRAFSDGRQVDLNPKADWEPTLHLLEAPVGDLSGLNALADEVFEPGVLDEDDRYGRCRALERFLRLSGRFSYSLEPQPRSPDLDPIEDFATNNPSGHCEYFATALVLMLRHQGIPARMVIGYRTGEWNDLGEFFQVRQLHAHAWVEAYLEAHHVPQDVREAGGDWSSGAWLRLDPTPPSAEGEAGIVGTALSRMDKYLTWLDYVWDNYVMQMNSPRQRRAVYDPLGASAREALKHVRDVGWWRNLLPRLRRAVASVENWFSWRGGLAAMGFMFATALVYRGTSRLAEPLRRWWRQRRREAVARRSRVAFYRRLESVLARHRLHRGASQTPREFAEVAGMRLAAATGQRDMAELPGAVVDAFYRVRFGGRDLDNNQIQAVEQALHRLEEAAGLVSARTRTRDHLQ